MIALENLVRVYGGRAPVQALRGVTLQVHAGEFVAIQGPSGSGKSTLLHLIGALDRPTAGRVTVDGVDLNRLNGDALADFRRETIGFVFQMFHLLPALTALENVMLPLWPYRRQLAFDLRARAQEMLAAVGLGARVDHLPGELSGGEQQRVAIARALVNHPKYLLADEPTGNLDVATAHEIVGLLEQVQCDHGVTIVLVTHDATVAAHADRVVRLRDGCIVADAAQAAS